MIAGIGIDIVELDRMQDKIMHTAFIKRVLTQKERDCFAALKTDRRRVEFLAGRFAAKEAFSKAAGTGIGRLGFQDMEVLPKENGAPQMHAQGFEQYHIFISLSHSEAYAVAQVILESQTDI